jgi:predicted transcriptional regulator
LAVPMSINEAARELGVSPDTVRRHIRIGLLQARQKPRGRGYQWMVELPGSLEAGSPSGLDFQTSGGPSVEEYQHMKDMVAELRRALEVTTAELEARREEVGRLLTLVEQAHTR